MLGGGDTLRVRDLGTGAEADVAFYLRNGLNGTIFVKNSTGTFSLGNDFGDNVEIEFIGDAGRANPVYQTNRVLPTRATPYNNTIQNEIYNTMMSQQANEQNRQQMKLQEQERQMQYHQQRQQEQMRQQQRDLQEHQRRLYEEQQRQEQYERESQQKRGRDRKFQNVEMNPEKVKFRRELDEFVEEGNDPYDILGLPEEFTFEQVKRSYKKKALRAHPDKGGSEVEFARVTKAYLFIKEEFNNVEFICPTNYYSSNIY